MRGRTVFLGLGLLLLVLQQGVLVSAETNTSTQNESVRPPVLLRNVTELVGLANNRVGDDRAVGQAWGDFDNDGWQDLYVTDTAGPNQLFRNIDGKRFERVANPTIALAEAYSGGAIFADYDNDGWQDLYVLNWGQNVLLRNLGNGQFTDVSTSAGVAGGDKNSQTASWGDYDKDGLLDLYVANWSCYDRCGRPQTGEGDKLYRNLGDGSFEDVTNLLGGATNGAGFVASFIDYDNDQDLDIYLVNDEFIYATGNKLWRNDGAGCDGWCFTEVSKESGSNSKLMGMGLASADYDLDGDLDLFYTNAGPMELLRNDGSGQFVNVAEATGVEFSEGIGWGTVFFDYNNDGWQDLYVATMGGTDGEHPGNPLYRNRGDGTFVQALEDQYRDRGMTLGVAKADYDQDGQVDLAIGNIDDGYHLLRNVNNEDNSPRNWVSLKLLGDGGAINRDAVGARVYLNTNEMPEQMQEVTAGSSLGAGNELALHFGINRAELADIRIVWPDGKTETLSDLCHNTRYEITYSAETAQLSAPTCTPVLEEQSENIGGIVGGMIGLLLLGGILLGYRKS